VPPRNKISDSTSLTICWVPVQVLRDSLCMPLMPGGSLPALDEFESGLYVGIEVERGAFYWKGFWEWGADSAGGI